MRLRHETFNRTSAGKHDRHRQRYRLRIAADFSLPHDVTIKTQFASGTGEQGSTNQTFDNLSEQKGFSIDQTYLVWTPWNELLKFQGGRMANPIWRTYTSDTVWDTDFNPEGFSQSLLLKISDHAKVFANLLQMVADEDPGNNSDQWMFGQQIGTHLSLPMDSKWSVAVSFYEWTNENFAPAGDFGEATSGAKSFGTNRVSGNILSNQFGVLEFTSELKTKVGHVPISVQGTFIKNTDNDPALNPKLNAGYQFGTRVGKAKKEKSWEIAYFRKWVQADATVANVADADFGTGGTNREGHIFWFAYSPLNWLQFKAKHFVTEVLDEFVNNTGKDNINRTQLDVIVKF